MLFKFGINDFVTVRFVHADQVKKNVKDWKCSGFSIIQPTLTDIPSNNRENMTNIAYALRSLVTNKVNRYWLLSQGINEISVTFWFLFCVCV